MASHLPRAVSDFICGLVSCVCLFKVAFITSSFKVDCFLTHYSMHDWPLEINQHTLCVNVKTLTISVQVMSLTWHISYYLFIVFVYAQTWPNSYTCLRPKTVIFITVIVISLKFNRDQCVLWKSLNHKSLIDDSSSAIAPVVPACLNIIIGANVSRPVYEAYWYLT